MVAKLDAAEAAQAEHSRREGAARRDELAKAVAAMRRRMRRNKQQVAANVRSEALAVSEATAGEVLEHRIRSCYMHRNVVSASARRANQVRSEEKLWKRQQIEREHTYIEQARQKRSWALAQREKTRLALAEELEGKRSAAHDVRTTHQVIVKERKASEAQREKMTRASAHQAAYGSRYATKAEAELFDKSPRWFKLTSWFKGPDLSRSSAVVVL